MRYNLFMMTAGRDDLLRRALVSIEPVWDKVVLVDNSPKGLVIDHPIEVVRNLIPWTFSQTQNFFQASARVRGNEMMLVMHDDAYLTDKDAISEFVKNAETVLEGNPLVGFVHASQDKEFFFSRDHLVSYRMKMVDEVGLWDTFLPQYGSDDDWFTRVYKKNWLAHLDVPTHEKLRHEGSTTVKSNNYFNYKSQLLQQRWVEPYIIEKWGPDHSFQHPFDNDYNWTLE
jgi:hypothetical protein